MRTKLQEPLNQVVYPWGLSASVDLEIKESLTSVYQTIGDNIALNGFKINTGFNNANVNFNIEPGIAIQDSSFLKLVDQETIVFDCSTHNPPGFLVVYLFFSGNNPKFQIGVTFRDGSVLDEWDEDNNLIVLNAYDFTKDTYNRITSVTPKFGEFVEIDGTTYYKKGLHQNNINLSNIISSIEYTNKYVSSDYVVTPNETVFVDTSSNTFNVDLPNKPPLGSKVTIIDASGSFQDNSPRIRRNGGKINGTQQDLFLRFKHSITSFYYSGETYGWIYNITRMWSVEGGTF